MPARDLRKAHFPAPLPGQAAPSNASPFPPVNGAAPAAAAGGPSPFPATGAAPITGSAFERGPAPAHRRPAVRLTTA